MTEPTEKRRPRVSHGIPSRAIDYDLKQRTDNRIWFSSRLEIHERRSRVLEWMINGQCLVDFDEDIGENRPRAVSAQELADQFHVHNTTIYADMDMVRRKLAEVINSEKDIAALIKGVVYESVQRTAILQRKALDFYHLLEGRIRSGVENRAQIISALPNILHAVISGEDRLLRAVKTLVPEGGINIIMGNVNQDNRQVHITPEYMARQLDEHMKGAGRSLLPFNPEAVKIGADDDGEIVDVETLDATGLDLDKRRQDVMQRPMEEAGATVTQGDPYAAKPVRDPAVPDMVGNVKDRGASRKQLNRTHRHPGDLLFG